MKVLILYDHIREEHFTMSKDGSVKNNILNTQNGKVLKQLLEKVAGLKRDRQHKDYDINFLYNAVPTPIRNDYGKIIKYQDVKLSEVKPYYERMNKIIVDNEYDMIIPLGKLGVKYLLNISSISKVRGIPSKVTIHNDGKEHATWVLPTYSIEYTNVNILPTIAKIGKIIPRVFKLNRGVCVASIIASKNFSFDKKPLNGGTPAILNAVITVRVKEIGMIVSKPPSFFTSRVPVTWSMAPVIINNAPLKVAWLIKWKAAAVKPAIYNWLSLPSKW